MMGVNHRIATITKNSLPLKAGDMLERYGKKFRKVKGKYGKPVFVVVSVDENNTDPTYFMSACITYNAHQNIINNSNKDLVVGQAV